MIRILLSLSLVLLVVALNVGFSQGHSMQDSHSSLNSSQSQQLLKVSSTFSPIDQDSHQDMGTPCEQNCHQHGHCHCGFLLSEIEITLSPENKSKFISSNSKLVASYLINLFRPPIKQS